MAMAIYCDIFGCQFHILLHCDFIEKLFHEPRLSVIYILNGRCYLCNPSDYNSVIFGIEKMFYSILNLNKLTLMILLTFILICRGQLWCRGIQYDCKIDWLWIRSPLEKMKYLFTFIFLFLRFGVEVKVRRWVPPLNTQYLQNSAESEEHSVLILGSLYLLCCVRDTAWSCLNLYFWFDFILICFLLIIL